MAMVDTATTTVETDTVAMDMAMVTMETAAMDMDMDMVTAAMVATVAMALMVTVVDTGATMVDTVDTANIKHLFISCRFIYNFLFILLYILSRCIIANHKFKYMYYITYCDI